MREEEEAGRRRRWPASVGARPGFPAAAAQRWGEMKFRVREGSVAVFTARGDVCGLFWILPAENSKLAEFFDQFTLIPGPNETDEFRTKFGFSGNFRKNSDEKHTIKFEI